VEPLLRPHNANHIPQLVSKRRAKKLKFGEVKDNIRKILKQQREKEAFQHWFSDLKNRAVIKINTSLL
jgi:hypothetical protein